MYRQGDVLLVPVGAIPPHLKAAQRDGPIVLARGEATGHAHVIACEGADLHGGRGSRYVRIPPGGAKLTHEEHGAIDLPEGAFRVIIQREYNRGKNARVAD